MVNFDLPQTQPLGPKFRPPSVEWHIIPIHHIAAGLPYGIKMDGLVTYKVKGVKSYIMWANWGQKQT